MCQKKGGKGGVKTGYSQLSTSMRLITPLSMVKFRELSSRGKETHPFVRHRWGVSELILHFFGFGAVMFAKNSGNCVVVLRNARLGFSGK